MRYNYYTDGACTLKQSKGEYFKGAGGWAWSRADENENVLESNSGGSFSTTNNEQELMAIYQAILHYKNNYFVESNSSLYIYSDSAYCINIFTQWIKKWEENGWTRGKKGEPIENLDLIKEIWFELKLITKDFNEVKFIKVKGHSDNFVNSYVDRLAVEQKKKFS